MEINCNQTIEKYLLNKNPLYAFSFPIALIVGIVFFGIAKANKWSNNDYINQILIPIVALLVTMVLIDIIARMMISETEKKPLLDRCEAWKKNNSMKKNKPWNPPIENFSSGSFSIQDNEIHNNNPNTKDYIWNHKIEKNTYDAEDWIAEIPHLYPITLDTTNDTTNVDSKCNPGKTCYQFCSGIDSVPESRIIPIPGPNWLPKSAETVQNELKNNIYTAASC